PTKTAGGGGQLNEGQVDADLLDGRENCSFGGYSAGISPKSGWLSMGSQPMPWVGLGVRPNQNPALVPAGGGSAEGMHVSAERIEPHADAAQGCTVQSANGGKRKRPDQETTSPARPRTVLDDHLMKQEAIALAIENIRSFTELGLDTTTLKRDLQALSAVGEPEAAAGPRGKIKASGPLSELGLGVYAAGLDATGAMPPEFRAWGGPVGTPQIHGTIDGEPPPELPLLSKADKKLFAAVVLINQLTQEAPDSPGAVVHKICWLSPPYDDPAKLGAAGGERAARPATEDTSPAGQMWRKGELVAEGVPAEDLFSLIAAAAATENLFYSSRRSLAVGINGLDASHPLVKDGRLSQWEVLYAKHFTANIEKYPQRKVFYFAQENFLCCCKSRAVCKTQLRTAARDAQSGDVWEFRSARAVQAFAYLGVPLSAGGAGLRLMAMIETLDASFRFVMPGLCKDVWDLPRYLAPGEAPLPAPVALAATEQGAEDGQINKDARGVAEGGSQEGGGGSQEGGGESLEGGGGRAVGAVGAAVASAADGLPTSSAPPVAHSDVLPAVASAAVASAAVASAAVASAANVLPTSASLA
ncbi:hypothetical protein T484DRAFT_2261960, partial [Baffinella frigidus]